MFQTVLQILLPAIRLVSGWFAVSKKGSTRWRQAFTKSRTAAGSLNPAAACGEGVGRSLLGDPVEPVPGLVLRRLDLDPELLAGGRDKSPDAVRLPLGRLHDLGEGGSLGPSDQAEDLRALALGAGGGGLLRAGGLGWGLGGLLAGCLLAGLGVRLGRLLGRRRGFAALDRKSTRLNSSH